MKFQRIPHISPTPDSVMMLPTWSGIGGHPELKMAAMRTQEVKIIFEPKELAKCLDRLPLHIQRRPTQI